LNKNYLKLLIIFYGMGFAYFNKDDF